MGQSLLHLLLADDDDDDRLFFRDALAQLPIAAHLTTVTDGEILMELLADQLPARPDVLFLDLNMPRKNGYECLVAIKQNPALCPIPVIILSTYFDPVMADRLTRDGALRCLTKPTGFWELKAMIGQVLADIARQPVGQPLLSTDSTTGVTNATPQ